MKAIRLLAALVAISIVPAAVAEDLPAWPSPQGLDAIKGTSAAKLRLVGQMGTAVIEDVAWSPGGEHLALRSSSGVTVYHTEPKLAKVRTFSGERPPMSMAFGTRDDAIAIADGGKAIKVCDIRTGWTRAEVKDAGSPVLHIAMSSKDPILAAATADGKLLIWRDEGLEGKADVLEDHGKVGTAGLAIDPTGQWAVTWTHWDKVHVWSLKDGKRTNELNLGNEKDHERVGPAAIGADGILWVFAGNVLRRWKVPSEEGVADVSRIPVSLGPGAFSSDGKLFVARGEKGPEVVNAASGETLRKVGAARSYGPAAFERKRGKSLAIVADGVLMLIDPRSGSAGGSEKLGDSALVAAFSPANGLLAWGPDIKSLQITDLKKSGKSAKVVGEGEVPFTTMAVDPKGRYIATAGYSRRKGIIISGVDIRGGSVPVLWQVGGGRLKRTPILDGELDGMACLAFSPDGEWLAMGTEYSENPQVKLYSVRTGKLRTSIKLPARKSMSSSVGSLLFDPKGKLLAANIRNDSKVFFIDVAQGKTAFDLTLSEGSSSWGTKSLVFNQQGTLLAVAGYGSGVTICDVPGKRIVKKIIAKDVVPQQVALSPDGALLAVTSPVSSWRNVLSVVAAVSQDEEIDLDEVGTAGSTNIALFDVSSGKLLRSFAAHSDSSTGIAFLQDGKILCSVARDGAIRMWGTRDAEPEKPADGKAADPKGADPKADPKAKAAPPKPDEKK